MNALAGGDFAGSARVCDLEVETPATRLEPTGASLRLFAFDPRSSAFIRGEICFPSGPNGDSKNQIIGRLGITPSSRGLSDPVFSPR
jgi:hypothetical protein